jgi:RNA recognition motif-containing protein
MDQHSFSPVGPVLEIGYLSDQSASILYDNIRDAQKAVDELDNSILDGQRIRVELRLRPLRSPFVAQGSEGFAYSESKQHRPGKHDPQRPRSLGELISISPLPVTSSPYHSTKQAKLPVGGWERYNNEDIHDVNERGDELP